MADSLPRISLVTPSYNQGHFIEETICSVLEQGYPDLQYIIIDGGSTDNTVEVIKKYEEHIDHWVSEPDKGQSDAINKGLTKCNGDVFNWLNSDDLLEPGTLSKIGSIFQREPKTEIVCGKEKAFRGEIENIEYENQSVYFPDNPVETLRSGHNDQPATFLKMDVVRKLAPVSTNLHYVMDMEWWWKYFLSHDGSKVKKVDDYFALFRLHGDSKTVAMQGLFAKDVLAMLASALEQVTDPTPFLSDVLRLFSKHWSRTGYRFTGNVESIESRGWERIVIHRTLKVARFLHSRKDFVFGRDFAKLCDEHEESIDLSHHEREQVDWILKRSTLGSWPLFKVRRKVNWLRGDRNW